MCSDLHRSNFCLPRLTLVFVELLLAIDLFFSRTCVWIGSCLLWQAASNPVPGRLNQPGPGALPATQATHALILLHTGTSCNMTQASGFINNQTYRSISLKATVLLNAKQDCFIAFLQLTRIWGYYLRTVQCLWYKPYSPTRSTLLYSAHIYTMQKKLHKSLMLHLLWFRVIMACVRH